MQAKNKSYEKNKFQIRRIRFYSAKVIHPFKNPHRLPTEPMGIHHSPHTHTIPIPMGIPIPTAALENAAAGFPTDGAMCQANDCTLICKT